MSFMGTISSSREQEQVEEAKEIFSYAKEPPDYEKGPRMYVEEPIKLDKHPSELGFKTLGSVSTECKAIYWKIVFRRKSGEGEFVVRYVPLYHYNERKNLPLHVVRKLPSYRSHREILITFVLREHPDDGVDEWDWFFPYCLKHPCSACEYREVIDEYYHVWRREIGTIGDEIRKSLLEQLALAIIGQETMIDVLPDCVVKYVNARIRGFK